MAVDGTLYIADSGNYRVRKVDPEGTITTVAGSGREGFSGDGGAAIRANLDVVLGVAVAADGTLYIADGENHRIRKVDAAGTITTVVGSGRTGYSGGGFSGDGGPATRARLASPERVAVAADGTIYISERANHRVRKVDPAGVITTVAGTGTAGFSGDGGPASRARLGVHGVAVAADGTLYFADRSHRIRKVDPAGTISTVVGSGSRGFSGDGGPPIAASLDGPADVTVATDGSLYIADSSNRRIRRVVFDTAERR